MNPQAGTNSNSRFWYWAKFSILLLFIGVMSTIVWLYGAQGWFDLEQVGLFLEGLGMLGPVAYIFLRMAGVVFLLPSLPLDAIAGAVFGPVLGTVYSVLGAGTGGLICFFIARALGREAITQWLKKDIAFCDLCAERQLVYVIFFTRLLPMISFDMISYGAGLTRVSLRGFMLATVLGMTPLTFAVSYSGKSFFNASGLTLFWGACAVAMFFLVPVWIKRQNPWGLYDRIIQQTRGR